MTIAEQVKAARKYHRWSQEQLEKLSGVCRSTISAVENGGGIHSEKLERLAETLRTRIVVGGGK